MSLIAHASQAVAVLVTLRASVNELSAEDTLVMLVMSVVFVTQRAGPLVVAADDVVVRSNLAVIQLKDAFSLTRVQEVVLTGGVTLKTSVHLITIETVVDVAFDTLIFERSVTMDTIWTSPVVTIISVIRRICGTVLDGRHAL